MYKKVTEFQFVSLLGLLFNGCSVNLGIVIRVKIEQNQVTGNSIFVHSGKNIFLLKAL